jgi:hypothetical protein
MIYFVRILSYINLGYGRIWIGCCDLVFDFTVIAVSAVLRPLVSFWI